MDDWVDGFELSEVAFFLAVWLAGTVVTTAAVAGFLWWRRGR